MDNPYKTKDEIKEYDFHYNRSVRGVFTRIYGGQRTSSKKRGHEMPDYTKEELIEWCYANGFQNIYNNWKRFNYNKMLKPSCDRIDEDEPYYLKNLRLTTWGDNLRQPKNGQNSINLAKRGTAVNQYTLDNEFVMSFLNITRASKKTGTNYKGISLCCKEKQKTAGGFIWKWRD